MRVWVVLTCEPIGAGSASCLRLLRGEHRRPMGLPIEWAAIVGEVVDRAVALIIAGCELALVGWRWYEFGLGGPTCLTSFSEEIELDRVW